MAFHASYAGSPVAEAEIRRGLLRRGLRPSLPRDPRCVIQWCAYSKISWLRHAAGLEIEGAASSDAPSLELPAPAPLFVSAMRVRTALVRKDALAALLNEMLAAVTNPAAPQLAAAVRAEAGAASPVETAAQVRAAASAVVLNGIPASFAVTSDALRLLEASALEVDPKLFGHASWWVAKEVSTNNALGVRFVRLPLLSLREHLEHGERSTARPARHATAEAAAATSLTAVDGPSASAEHEAAASDAELRATALRASTSDGGAVAEPRPAKASGCGAAAAASTVLLQQYVADPLLAPDGCKFHLRVNVLVTGHAIPPRAPTSEGHAWAEATCAAVAAESDQASDEACAPGVAGAAAPYYGAASLHAPRSTGIRVYVHRDVICHIACERYASLAKAECEDSADASVAAGAAATTPEAAPSGDMPPADRVRFAHITNNSVQRAHPDYARADKTVTLMELMQRWQRCGAGSGSLSSKAGASCDGHPGDPAASHGAAARRADDDHAHDHDAAAAELHLCEPLAFARICSFVRAMFAALDTHAPAPIASAKASAGGGAGSAELTIVGGSGCVEAGSRSRRRWHAFVPAENAFEVFGFDFLLSKHGMTAAQRAGAETDVGADLEAEADGKLEGAAVRDAGPSCQRVQHKHGRERGRDLAAASARGLPCAAVAASAPPPRGPWPVLLEVNGGPALEGGAWPEKCREVVEDTLRVAVDPWLAPCAATAGTAGTAGNLGSSLPSGGAASHSSATTTTTTAATAAAASAMPGPASAPREAADACRDTRCAAERLLLSQLVAVPGTQYVCIYASDGLALESTCCTLKESAAAASAAVACCSPAAARVSPALVAHAARALQLEAAADSDESDGDD